MNGPSRRNLWYIAASMVVSCAIFAYLFTMVSPGEIGRAIRNAYLPGVLAYMAVGMLSTVFRNIRYCVLTRATDTDLAIGGGRMFLVTLVRNLFSDLLPARVGSLIYVVILKARFGFPVEIGTSVWAVAFVLDLVVMVPLIWFGVSVLGAARLGIPLITVFVIALPFFILTVAVLACLPRLVIALGKIPARLFPRWHRAEIITEKLALTAQQIQAIYQKGIFWRVVLLSFLIRVLKYGCIAFLVYAILNPIDPQRYTLAAIGYWPVFVGAAMAELAASTPLSGIAGFGLYEGVWAGSFYLLGYPRELAVLSGISAHVITQAFGYSLGILAILILMAPLLRRKQG